MEQIGAAKEADGEKIKATSSIIHDCFSKTRHSKSTRSHPESPVFKTSLLVFRHP
jgi:hypothetical protein